MHGAVMLPRPVVTRSEADSRVHWHSIQPLLETFP